MLEWNAVNIGYHSCFGGIQNSNLCSETGYPDRGFRGFSHLLQKILE
jgi:hypothetical protein